MQTPISETQVMPASPTPFGRASKAAPDPVPAAPPPAADMVAEEISVVLRRQVPPRDGEEVRSWLGGLPRMSEGVEWPRSVSSEYPGRGERPLHFLAQICCADLPPALWGGLGPRAGWLLVFVDPNQGCPDDADSFHIVHVAELGPERAPPFDLGPVHDRVYCGGSYRWLPDDQVPPVWRRWPIDLVSFPNVLQHEGDRSFATPAGFAETLYPGAAIQPWNDWKAMRPYRFDQALRAVRGLAETMRREPRPVASEHVLELLRSEDGLAGLRDGLAARIVEVGARADTPHRTDHLGRLARIETVVGGCATADDLLERLEAERAAHAAWRTGIAEHCDLLAGMLEREAPQTALAAEDWEELQASLGGKEWRWLELAIEHPRDRPKHLDLGERTEQARLEIPAGLREQALDDWLNPLTRARVPAEAMGDLEAAARSLYSDRPHRMGGYHDGVQSDAAEGPQKELLLFQIASDDAMDWGWGDGGAYYFRIRPRHLAAGDFSGVRMDLECH